MNDKLDVGHALYMDNFYNSYDLSKSVQESNSYCEETLHIAGKITKRPVVSCSSIGIAIGKLCDMWCFVYSISLHRANEMVSFINKSSTIQTQPLLVVKYNSYMSV